MARDTTESEYQRGAVVAFRAPPQMIERLDNAAAAEGISRSDVARRAVIRDLRQPEDAR
jgi:metal-responsive CopG/Arc/MetJ family transcriptional regulator